MIYSSLHVDYNFIDQMHVLTFDTEHNKIHDQIRSQYLCS